MQNLELTEFITLSEKLKPFKNDCFFDMDYFIKTLSDIKGKKIRPDLIGSIITHYASKWLPELAGDEADRATASSGSSSESVTVSWTKKRFIIESLVGVLPPERDSIPCNFLLRLLRAANMVRVEPVFVSELEKRVSWQLDQASLKELMIPSFSHTSSTLLDVELVLRLVKNFVNVEEAARGGGAAVVKVAKLVDSYLAEAALDAYLALPEFMALAGALPSHARSIDDGLYRAIDTYLK
ncbi:Phototropic-responsive NPH3 family protein, partial [Perilla frutescens var. frutescens]